jgi:hypothetical protein
VLRKFSSKYIFYSTGIHTILQTHSLRVHSVAKVLLLLMVAFGIKRNPAVGVTGLRHFDFLLQLKWKNNWLIKSG